MYQIAYGSDTGSIEDIDQLVVLTLPDECRDMETVELSFFIDKHWATPDCDTQPLVPMNDVVDALRLALSAHDIRPDITESVVATLIDAVDNNG